VVPQLVVGARQRPGSRPRLLLLYHLVHETGYPQATSHGQKNGGTLQISKTITLDAPLERVWAHTLDLDALPSITPTVTKVERLDGGPVRIGSRARLTQPGLPPLVWTVEAVDAPYRFAWGTRLFGVRMIGIHELAFAGPNITHLTLRVVFAGRGSAVLGRLARRNITRALQVEAQGFERASSAAPA
jgi:hypothetical protein